VPRLRVAPSLAIGASEDCAIRLPSWTGSSCLPHAVRMCMRSETTSKAPTSYGRRGIPLYDCLQQVEKYDTDSSSVCSQEEVGDEDEDEGGAHYTRAAADVPRTDVLFCSHTSLSSSLLPSPCLSFTDGARQLLGFRLGPIRRADARFAVVHLGGVCVSLTPCTTGGAPCLLERCLWCRQRVGRSLIVVIVVRIVSAHS
jgi:hypothetical protein